MKKCHVCLWQSPTIDLEVVEHLDRHTMQTCPGPELLRLRAENQRLSRLLNTPETKDFILAVQREAGHQRLRWGSSHDAGKTPADWFWLIGYLAGKALHATASGDQEKALHHCVSTAAALANWHLALPGADTSMRPGLPDQGEGNS